MSAIDPHQTLKGRDKVDHGTSPELGSHIPRRA